MGIFLRIIRTVVPLLLSLVPGWGHIWLRRGSTGLMIFMLFFASLNMAVLIGNDLLPAMPKFFGNLAKATAAATFAFSILDVLRATVWTRSRPVQERRRRILRTAAGHLIRREFGQAEEQLERVLRIDPGDPAAWAWLGSLYSVTGRRREARHAWKQARFYGQTSGWREMINPRLEELRRRP
jgi:tetratricopeptide (TPR) repeat protein